ncbi:MAG TPA: quinol:electron acceptor oxidoreductase subunit ActD [Anaerolineales bacterium]|nr:quinol:electron acceptor oxidoreductase subunit ActD [Anaerolineales bacterium]
MAESSTTLLAVFDEIELTTQGIEKLHELGVQDRDINVISGVPIPGRVLGRPSALTNVSRIAMVGAGFGMLLGLFLIYGTPYLYPLQVGGQPIYPVPMGWIVTFEMTMLGLMGFAFIGLFVDSGFPAYTPMEYMPEISDGKIAVLFSVPSQDQEKFVNALTSVGAESVTPAEARHL